MVNSQLYSNVLKVLLWNANGIKHNEAEFLNLIQEKQIYLAIISKTPVNRALNYFSRALRFIELIILTKLFMQALL